MLNKKKPAWLKKDLAVSLSFKGVNNLMEDENINTVCREARCPNIAECWSKKHATFLLLGEFCTRDCMFCSVKKDILPPESKDETVKILNAVSKMELKYVVLTSVTRDDLKDGGASVFFETVKAIKNFDKKIIVEVLVPDFLGDEKNIETVIKSGADVFSHNIEMPEELYKKYRKKASYDRSLYVLKKASEIKDFNIVIKSGLMLGLGESDDAIKKVFTDLVSSGVDILVLGQYLRPSRDSAPVIDYVKPEKFEHYRHLALSFGFKEVVASPFARTSYQAKEAYSKVLSLKNISKKCKNKA